MSAGHVIVVGGGASGVILAAHLLRGSDARLRVTPAASPRPPPQHAAPDRRGRRSAASPRVFAVGPVTRARHWEITAVPDIRAQCAALAQRIRAQVLGP